MGPITNYATLIDAFRDYLIDDAVLDVDRMLQLAEFLIYTEVRLRENTTSVDLPVTGNSTTVPSDFLEALAVIDTNRPGPPLNYQPPAEFYAYSRIPQPAAPFMTAMRPQSRVYTLVGTQLLFSLYTPPTTLTLIYYRKFPPLNASTPTDVNDLLIAVPQLFLYAMLARAGPFVREQAIDWMAVYNEERTRLHAAYARSMLRPGGERRRY